MGILRKIIAAVTVVALVGAFMGAGFAACTAPPATMVLSNMFSDDATSPFSRSQLVQVADATRDYSFGEHSVGDLYRVIYEIDLQYKQQVESGGGALPIGFPELEVVVNADDVKQFEAAFAGASEMYCYSPNTVAHLDDCYALARVAYPLVATFALLGAIALAVIGIMDGKRKVGNVLLIAGVVVVVAFVILGAWAVVDFTGFFATFHSIFFSKGNWTFPYDSLLICALPTSFWVGMGGIWLAVAVIASILSIVIGRKCR